MRLINMTPHPLVIYSGDKIVVDLPRAEVMARRDEKRTQAGAIDVNGSTILVDEVWFGPVTDLPAPREGVVYVVSRATAEGVPGWAGPRRPGTDHRMPWPCLREVNHPDTTKAPGPKTGRFYLSH